MSTFTISQTAADQYRVEGFLQSLPNVVCVVTFENGVARVTQREGTTETCWDRQAIEAVQFALITSWVV